MNHEVKAQWIAALRSGEYEQGRERLRDDENRFCCLGVLCDLAGKTGLGAWNANRFVDEAAFLPPVVAAWADLTERNPKIDGISLTAFNDGDETLKDRIHPHTFTEIADLIEQHL